MSERRAKALGLISGGLDSTLALKIVRDVLGCEVRAITFYTGFCITEAQRRRGGRRDGTIPRNEALRTGADLEIEIELIDISDHGYLDVITHPTYGYGANANPCVDCRIDMFRRARAILDAWGGDFVFTGEVLGQRPKSQRRDTMWVVERDSGLAGRLLRPLSAKLLDPTIAESERLIDREKLFGISGRGRKAQIALARELGISDWPQPAGGCCYLTDEAFARKFFDLVDRRPDRRIAREEIVLLATGRHFRLSDRAKLIVGRDEGENAALDRFANGRIRLEAVDWTGPVGLVEGELGPEEKQLASSILARYGKGRHMATVRIAWTCGDRVEWIDVAPHPDEEAIERMRV